VQAVLPPILRERNQRWSYHGTKCALFLGNIAHFPNRLAIEWICNKLAPEMRRVDRHLAINIIGATAAQVPPEWRSSNINFLGTADSSEVVRQMTSTDLFIAPIANEYGAKMKLAECVAHGTPFVATRGAMSGLPFLDAIPRIALDEPSAAAHLIQELLRTPEALIKLSQSITLQAGQASEDQQAAWISILSRCLASRSSRMPRELI
jgi:hypothetical protein